jgi:hypothetical protein
MSSKVEVVSEKSSGITRHSTCPSCGHYDWMHYGVLGCKVRIIVGVTDGGQYATSFCECSALADGRRIGTGRFGLSPNRGLAARLLLGLRLRYYAVCDFVNDLARRI